MQLRRKALAAAITGGITDGLTGPIVGAAASASNDPLWVQDFNTAQLIPGAIYTRATDQHVVTDTSALFPVPAGAIPIQNARPVRNLAASSDTPSTQNITVVVGRIYAVRIGAESASGATAVCSGAFTGTLTGDGADSYALNGVATTTTLTVTITGSVRKLQVQDITHRAFNNLGADVVTNGTFDTDTDWTKLSATISGGVATFAGAVGTQEIQQSKTLINGAYYLVNLDVSGVSTGSVIFYLGTTSSSDNRYAKNFGIANGHLSWVLQASTSDSFKIGLSNSDTGSIDNVTVRPLSDADLVPDEYVDSATDYGTGLDGFRYFTTALANTVDGSGVVTEATGAALSNIALANVPGSTNLADGTHDYSAGADTITLSSTGYYTLWLEGTAQVTIAAGTATITGAGSATEGNPVTINCTATGTVTLTLDSGTLDTVSPVDSRQIIQLNGGTVPIPLIPTSGSTASTDSAVLDFSGVSGFATPNETRVVATGLNASLEPDPTETTERNVDADDWDGTDLSDILPHANIKSVTVYAPGERP